MVNVLSPRRSRRRRGQSSDPGDRRASAESAEASDKRAGDEALADPESASRWAAASPFLLTLAGGLLLWAAFPPLGLWPLAFVAPVPWLLLVRQESLPGKRPYLGIWAAGVLFWLLMLHGIRMPHWSLYFGWLALSLYLAVYLAGFVGLTRVAVQRAGWPLLAAAPVVWMGLEWLRSWLLSGFPMGLIGHSQTPWVTLIQVADLGGAYLVGFLVLLAAACLARMVPMENKPFCSWPLIPAVAVLGVAWVYGALVQQGAAAPASPDSPRLKVALLQGDVDVVFPGDRERDVKTFLQYRQLAIEARTQHPDLNLIVWPESTFCGTPGEWRADGPPQPPAAAQMSQEELEKILAKAADHFSQLRARTAVDVNLRFGERKTERLKIHQLVGAETMIFGDHPPERYNGALLLDEHGAIVSRYYKMHRVAFGEFIPLGDQLPWIYRLSPMTMGLTPGSAPSAFELGGVRLAPHICFESTIPHLIRGQVQTLRDKNEDPDVLVNLSNDGWFWGTSMLDLHFACSVFRAVELRRPLLAAANTGITAWVDAAGRVRQRAPKRKLGFVVAEVGPRRPGRTLYQWWGDTPAALCLAACGFLAVLGWRGRAVTKSPLADDGADD